MGINVYPPPPRQRRVVILTSSQTVAVDDVVNADAAAGPVTVTLPANPTSGQSVTIKKTDPSSNIVTVAAQSGALIDGDPNAEILTQHSVIEVTFNGTNWSVTASYREGAGPSSASVSGFRNVIRNGDFSVAQRGDSPGSINDGAYGFDGWVQYRSGALGLSSARSNFGTSYQPYKWHGDFTRSGGAPAASDYSAFAARIEDVRTLAGKRVTLAFNASADIAGRKVGIAVRQYFGTGGSPSAVYDEAVTVEGISLTTSQTRYSVTFTMPSIAGKTIGTNENSWVEVRFWLGCGTGFTYHGLGSAASQGAFTIYMSGVQLEEGSTPTPFEFIPYQQQLAWCQRYLLRFNTDAVNQVFGWGTASSATTGFVEVPFPVAMRATPVLTTSGAINMSDRLANFPATAISLQSCTGINPTIADLAVTCSGGGMTTRAAHALYAGASGSYIQFSAEL